MKKSLKAVSAGLALIFIVSALGGCSFNLDFSKKAEIQKADGVSKTTVSAGTETRLGSVKENGCELVIDGNAFSGDVEIEIVPASDLLPKEALSTDRTELVISPVKINCGGYDGSIFDKDIKLTLPMPEGANPEQCLFGYYDEEKKEVRYFFPDSCDPGNGTMTLNLPHFSLWWSSKPTTEQQIDAFLDSYCTQLAVNRGQSKKAAADLEPYVRAKVEAMGLTKQAAADLVQSTVNFLGGRFTGDNASYIEMGTKYVSTLARGYYDGDGEAALNGLNDAINDALMNGWDELKFSDRLDDVLGSEFAGSTTETLLSSSSGIARMAGCFAGGDTKGAMKELGDIMQGIHPAVELSTKAVALLGSSVNLAFTCWKSNQIEELYQIYKNGAEDVWGNEVISQNRKSFLTYLNTSSGFTMAKGVGRFYKLDKVAEICETYGWPYSSYEELPPRFREEFEKRAEAGLMEYFEMRVQQEKEAEKIKKDEKVIIETMLSTTNGALSSLNSDARKFFREESAGDYNVTARLQRLINVRQFVSQFVDEKKIAETTKAGSFNYGDVINWWVGYAVNNEKDVAVENLLEDLNEYGLLKDGFKLKKVGKLLIKSFWSSRIYSCDGDCSLTVHMTNDSTSTVAGTVTLQFDEQVRETVKKALEKIKVDDKGDFSVDTGSDGSSRVVFAGHIDMKTMTGSGTYKFNLGGHKVTWTQQDYINAFREGGGDWKWTGGLEGDYTWLEEGEFTISYDPEKDGKNVVTFRLNGNVTATASGTRVGSLYNVDYSGAPGLSVGTEPFALSRASEWSSVMSFTVSGKE